MATAAVVVAAVVVVVMVILEILLLLLSKSITPIVALALLGMADTPSIENITILLVTVGLMLGMVEVAFSENKISVLNSGALPHTLPAETVTL